MRGLGELVFGGPALLASLVLGLAMLPDSFGGPAPVLVFGRPTLLELFVLGLTQLLLVLVGGPATQLPLFVLGLTQLLLVLVGGPATQLPLFVLGPALPGALVGLIPQALVLVLALHLQLLVFGLA